ncbi:sporulation protein YhbH [Domibacillus sp. PGB-M46]|uniref:sporulation protein YhbH n=1 Tax=Domibacillus sp. PGB-M46 TaxID=2910255 RepID=UPI001F5AE027|nr:sporulation protein YhbH [Domibacillus sp. PGB-M46]MCI2253537.1 sporulation protein YhbH [Domibacillus sp. PGB-M46]
MDTSYHLSEEDWSLHRKGYDDQERHRQKVKEAIKKNLADMVTEEQIIMSDGKRTVKLPIRSLQEYKIRYSDEKSKHTGQGKGEVGDAIARAGGDEKSAAGQGKKAGNQRGEDFYEAEVSMAEIEDALFSELALPNLAEKEKAESVITDWTINDIRKTGVTARIDKKKTLMAAFKRNALAGEMSFFPVRPEDRRFRSFTEEKKPQSKAVIFAMMDTSGSMGPFEKYIARSFFFWMTRFLRKKYTTVDIVFIAHHTEALQMEENDFFTKGESGGTICSSAYRLVLELMEKKYSPERYNIYPFHFSDGDNLASDNPQCVALLEKILPHCRLFGYGEVNQYNRTTPLMSAFRKVENPLFKSYVIRKREDVYPALSYFFQPDK